MLSLVTLLLLSSFANALTKPGSALDSHNSKTVDLIDCKDSDLCCRWAVFPKWTKTFTDKKAAIPAFSVSWSRNPDAKVGESLFKCVDERDEATLPADEEKDRGFFKSICPSTSVLTTWPITGRYMDNPLEDFEWHRSVCMPYEEKSAEFFSVHANKHACYYIELTDPKINVFTIYTVSAAHTDTLAMNYLSIMPASNRGPWFRTFTSSTSVIMSPGKYYACVYNYKQGDDTEDPVKENMIAHVRFSRQ